MKNTTDFNSFSERVNQLSEFKVPEYGKKIIVEQESMEVFHPEIMDMSKDNKNTLSEPIENQDFKFRIARIGENKVRIQDSETGDKIDVPNDLISLFCEKITSFNSK